MTSDKFSVSINSFSGTAAQGSSVLQIYAPGAEGLEPDFFSPNPAPELFSPEWLLFYEAKAPLIGREEQLAELTTFLNDERAFLWWAVTGPAGIGKSRLAHALIESLPESYLGAFLARDRITEGAASNWTPLADSLWIIDYAAAHRQVLARFLAVLARRMANGPFKVRILLLEREATPTSSWWRGLLQGDGRYSAAIRGNLFGDPRELPPLGDKANELLAALLTLAGLSEDESRRRVENEDPAALARLTGGGRPLLVALTAAAMVPRDNAFSSNVTLPRNALDWYLGRELRLWRERAGSDERFDAVCYTAFFTTFVAQFSLPRSRAELMPNEQAALDKAQVPADEADKRIEKRNLAARQFLSQTTGYAQAPECLLVLEQAGISSRNNWCLQPDMLGERLIQIMMRRPLDADDHFMSFPSYDADRLANLMLYALAMPNGRGHETLARLGADDVADIAGLIAARTGQTMRYVLILLRSTAQMRRTALPPETVLSAMSSANFPKSFQPEITNTIRQIYSIIAVNTTDTANTASITQALEVALDQDVFNRTGVWLIPFMSVIADLQGTALLALVSFYSRRLTKMTFTRTREVILGLNLLRRACNDIIFERTDPNVLALDAPSPAARHWLQDVLILVSTLTKGAASTGKKAEPEDLHELSRAVCGMATQLSYVFLKTAIMASGESRRTMNTAAADVARAGLIWAKNGGNQDLVDVLIRNRLAGDLANRINDPALLTARTKLLDQYRSEDKLKQFLDILTDSGRIAVEYGDADGLTYALTVYEQHADWLGEAGLLNVENESEFFCQGVRRIANGGEPEKALAFTKQYGAFVMARMNGIDDTGFHTMVETLADELTAARSPLFAQLLDWLESLYDALNNHADVASQFAIRFIGYAVASACSHAFDVSLRLFSHSAFEVAPENISLLLGNSLVADKWRGTDRLTVVELVSKMHEPGSQQKLMGAFARPVQTDESKLHEEENSDEIDTAIGQALMLGIDTQLATVKTFEELKEKLGKPTHAPSSSL